ncbi:MAG: M55 family metallopeptidase [Verrucomicrobiae bacterium]|nr:M55 family metallopeptidase [Verrucomicrobiae bacterium]
MKILICTDLEGVSGVVSFEEQAYATGRYYEQAKRLLTAEVNAAIEGLLEEGVEETLVVDGHGPGAICFEELHPAARLFHGRPWAWRVFCDEVIKTFDATVMIGQHAMAGVERGTLNHTQSSKSIDYYKLNGRLIGEIAQWALKAGHFGVPLIFLSGDDAACREAEELVPGMATAAVKTGMSRTSAISLAPAEARRRIREGIKQAVRRHREHPLAPVAWPGPFVLEKKFFHSGSVDGYAGHPMAKILDPQRVQLRSENIMDIIYA